MGLITRPTKLGGGTDVIAGNDVLASEWNGDMNTIYTLVNGNLENINIKAGAAIVGSKIADAPNGISAAQLNTDAVETAKIKALAVTLAKLNADVILGEDHLKITVHNKAVDVNVGVAVTQFESMDPYAIDTGTNWDGKVKLVFNGATQYRETTTEASPSSTFAKATYDLIGLYPKDIDLGTANHIKFTLVYVFLAKVS